MATKTLLIEKQVQKYFGDVLTENAPEDWHLGSKHFSTVDILGTDFVTVDLSGIDIMGVDV